MSDSVRYLQSDIIKRFWCSNRSWEMGHIWRKKTHWNACNGWACARNGYR